MLDEAIGTLLSLMEKTSADEDDKRSVQGHWCCSFVLID